jgi:Amt family ammonium transporter
MSHGLSLSELGTLGVDVIDIGGSTSDATLHIDSADTLAMSNAELSFATGDNIVLDATAAQLADADADASGSDSDYDGTSSGSYLTGSLDSAVSGMFGGLGLSDLQALGVDVIAPGALLTGVFAAPSLGGTGIFDYVANAASADYSIGGQVLIQLEAVITTIVWSGVVSFIGFKVVDMVVGLRVTEEEEREGLDISSHGETAYHR